MWSFLLVFSAVIAWPALTQESTDVLGDNTRPAQEKNLLQFAKMIWTVTGRSPLDYNNYGCYCGHGGAGTPVDDIDRCCQAHDRCYDTVDYPKFTTYRYTATRGAVTCLDAAGCNERAVCDCDRDAVLCLNSFAYTGKKPCSQTTTLPSPTTDPPPPLTTTDPPPPPTTTYPPPPPTTTYPPEPPTTAYLPESRPCGDFPWDTDDVTVSCDYSYSDSSRVGELQGRCTVRCPVEADMLVGPPFLVNDVIDDGAYYCNVGNCTWMGIEPVCLGHYDNSTVITDGSNEIRLVGGEFYGCVELYDDVTQQWGPVRGWDIVSFSPTHYEARMAWADLACRNLGFREGLATTAYELSNGFVSYSWPPPLPFHYQPSYPSTVPKFMVNQSLPQWEGATLRDAIDRVERGPCPSYDNDCSNDYYTMCLACAEQDHDATPPPSTCTPEPPTTTYADSTTPPTTYADPTTPHGTKNDPTTPPTTYADPTTPPPPTTYADPTTPTLPPTTYPYGCEYEGQFYDPGETIEVIPGCYGGIRFCTDYGEVAFEDIGVDLQCCEYNGRLYEEGETITTADGVTCRCYKNGFWWDGPSYWICEGCEYNGQWTADGVTCRCYGRNIWQPPYLNCEVQTTTPPSPTTYPPEPPTTTYPPPPTTTYPTPPPPPGCDFDGQFYPPGTTIQDIPGCFGHVIICDEDGELRHGDYFGHGCCEHDGQYYEDGETITTADGVFCYCVGSDTDEAAPMICGVQTTTPSLPTTYTPEPPTTTYPTPPPPPGCDYEGQFYPPGTTIEEVPGCFGYIIYCDYYGNVVIEDYFGCCEHDGQYYEDGETIITADGARITCETTPPPTTPPPTTPPPPPETTLLGCYDGVQFYPAGTVIEDVPGCFGYYLACGDDGEFIYGDNFGYGCCEHDGQHYEDGETIITADGVTCHCEGSDFVESVPMTCDGTTVPPTTLPPTTTLPTTTTLPPTTIRVGCEYGGRFYPAESIIISIPGCTGGDLYCDEEGWILFGYDFGHGCCEHNGLFFGDGQIYFDGDVACYCDGSTSNNNYIAPMICQVTTTPPSPTTYPPEPTTTYPPPPPTTPPLGCDYGGQFYPAGTTIEEVPGCFGYIIICDDNGGLLIGDNFGYGCCEYDGQYYEDGETITTANGVTCYCEGSDHYEPAPMVCEGCEYLGQFYPIGSTIEEEPGCFGYAIFCYEYGVVIADNFGFGCCEHDGEYYEDGETITTADGVTCRCERSDTGEPVPMICEETTTTIPPTTPRHHGCEYGGEFYPPNTIIEETPGCFGRTVCCDEYGQVVIWENWGYQCCQYNGQYYEDGETITRADGATCHCEGSNTYEPAPMICDDQQVYLTTVGTWQFYKVRVTGQMTNANVKATCEAAGMRYPCYSSGRDGCTNYYWASDCICYDAAISCLTHEVLSAHLCGTTAGAGSRCEPLDDTFAYMPIWLHGDDSAIGVDYQTHTYGLYGADYNNMYALCAGAGP